MEKVNNNNNIIPLIEEREDEKEIENKREVKISPEDIVVKDGKVRFKNIYDQYCYSEKYFTTFLQRCNSKYRFKIDVDRDCDPWVNVRDVVNMIMGESSPGKHLWPVRERLLEILDPYVPNDQHLYALLKESGLNFEDLIKETIRSKKMEIDNLHKIQKKLIGD